MTPLQQRGKIVVSGLAMGEAPRWHDGALYLVDMPAGQVLRVAPDGLEVLVSIEGTPGGLGWLPDGSLLVVAQEARQIMQWDGAHLSVHADLAAFGDSPLNDMWVDPDGRAYVGEMGFDIQEFHRRQQETPATAEEMIKTAHVFAVEPDGTVARASGEDLLFCNGIEVNADGSLLVLAESFALRLALFDRAADGTLSGHRTIGLSFPPDGIALDAAGNVWVADPVGHRAVLVSPAGEELNTVGADGICLAVALDPAGRTLFVVSTLDTEPDAARQSRASTVRAVTLT